MSLFACAGDITACCHAHLAHLSCHARCCCACTLTLSSWQLRMSVHMVKARCCSSVFMVLFVLIPISLAQTLKRRTLDGKALETPLAAQDVAGALAAPLPVQPTCTAFIVQHVFQQAQLAPKCLCSARGPCAAHPPCRAAALRNQPEPVPPPPLQTRWPSSCGYGWCRIWWTWVARSCRWWASTACRSRWCCPVATASRST